MPKNSITNTLPFMHNDLFNLVQDIEKYPEFLPWCSAARIIKKVNDNLFHAELIINYKSFNASYVSSVELIRDVAEPKIIVSLIKGPFKYLYNTWHFKPQNQSTEITFSIDFEIKFSLISKIVNNIFEKIFIKMYQAFYDRAEYLYGIRNNHDKLIDK